MAGRRPGPRRATRGRAAPASEPEAEAVAKQAAAMQKGQAEAIRAAIADRSSQLGGKRETDTEQLRVRWGQIPEERREEVLDQIAEERERLRADYEERQAKAAHLPHVLEEV